MPVSCYYHIPLFRLCWLQLFLSCTSCLYPLHVYLGAVFIQPVPESKCRFQFVVWKIVCSLENGGFSAFSSSDLASAKSRATPLGVQPRRCHFGLLSFFSQEWGREMHCFATGAGIDWGGMCEQEKQWIGCISSPKSFLFVCFLFSHCCVLFMGSLVTVFFVMSHLLKRSIPWKVWLHACCVHAVPIYVWKHPFCWTGFSAVFGHVVWRVFFLCL